MSRSSEDEDEGELPKDGRKHLVLLFLGFFVTSVVLVAFATDDYIGNAIAVAEKHGIAVTDRADDPEHLSNTEPSEIQGIVESSLKECYQPKPIVRVTWKKKNVSSRPRKERVAVCLTGQLRGLPLSFAQWNDGGFFNLLTANKLGIDFFIVTEATHSFSLWSKAFIPSIKPFGAHVIDFMSFVDSPDQQWAVLEEASHTENNHYNLTFNIAKFPKATAEGAAKRKVFILQQWQAEKCRDLIVRREAEIGKGFRYKRVARVRPDVAIFASYFEDWDQFVTSEVGECLLDLSYQVCGRTTPFNTLGARQNQEILKNTTTSQINCEDSRSRARNERLDACANCFHEYEQRSTEWYNFIGDWIEFGSRDVMVNEVLRGLQWLEHEHSTNPGRMLTELEFFNTWTPHKSAVTGWDCECELDADLVRSHARHNNGTAAPLFTLQSLEYRMRLDQGRIGIEDPEQIECLRSMVRNIYLSDELVRCAGFEYVAHDFERQYGDSGVSNEKYLNNQTNAKDVPQMDVPDGY